MQEVFLELLSGHCRQRKLQTRQIHENLPQCQMFLPRCCGTPSQSTSERTLPSRAGRPSSAGSAGRRRPSRTAQRSTSHRDRFLQSWQRRINRHRVKESDESESLAAQTYFGVRAVNVCVSPMRFTSSARSCDHSTLGTGFSPSLMRMTKTEGRYHITHSPALVRGKIRISLGELLLLNLPLNKHRPPLYPPPPLTTTNMTEGKCLYRSARSCPSACW